MGRFSSLRPETAEAGQPLVVEVFQDPESTGWVAVCDDIPIATEAETVDALIERVWLIAPEVAELNGLSGADLQLRFVVNTRSAA